MRARGPLANRPPKHVAPERLFRLLSEPTRPRLGIAVRLRDAEHIPLEVLAPTAHELQCAIDQQGDDAAAAAASQQSALIASVLWAGGERAFRLSRDVGLLHPVEVTRLVSAVLNALDTIAPGQCRSDMAVWRARLKQGAAHRSNHAVVQAMAGTRDLYLSQGYKPLFAPRPDRYYGRAVCELTEGQLLAYDAACSAVDDATEDHG